MSPNNETTLTKQAYFPDYHYYYAEYDYFTTLDGPDGISAPENTSLPLPPPSPTGTAEAETSDIRSFFPETWLWSMALLSSVFCSCGSLSGWFSASVVGWFFSGRQEGSGCAWGGQFTTGTTRSSTTKNIATTTTTTFTDTHNRGGNTVHSILLPRDLAVVPKPPTVSPWLTTIYASLSDFPGGGFLPVWEKAWLCIDIRQLCRQHRNQPVFPAEGALLWCGTLFELVFSSFALRWPSNMDIISQVDFLFLSMTQSHSNAAVLLETLTQGLQDHLSDPHPVPRLPSHLPLIPFADNLQEIQGAPGITGRPAVVQRPTNIEKKATRSYFPETWLWQLSLLSSVSHGCCIVLWCVYHYLEDRIVSDDMALLDLAIPVSIVGPVFAALPQPAPPSPERRGEGGEEGEAVQLRSYFPETWLWELSFIPSVSALVVRVAYRAPASVAGMTLLRSSSAGVSPDTDIRSIFKTGQEREVAIEQASLTTLTKQSEESTIRSHFPETWLWSLSLLTSVWLQSQLFCGSAWVAGLDPSYTHWSTLTVRTKQPYIYLHRASVLRRLPSDGNESPLCRYDVGSK
ncbi:hypothetical protein E2C01_023681 [Portunus trituberculatus]|uniref:Uncharacterized protein n=1 Tax=Portunus trituberculatus TaxID=210409 RepID=A0A5B7EB79_PORTR|nr:hypothetical protein [Portunus trituberculatus]